METSAIMQTEEPQELNIPEGVEIRSGNDYFDPVEVPEEEEEVVSEGEDYTPNEETQAEQVEEEQVPELKSDTSNFKDIEEQLKEGQNGIESMLESAVKDEKLTQDDVDLLYGEYETNGTLSEKSLSKLEAAGFSRGFVKAYIQGQEALAHSYTNAIYEYAGGKQQFDKYVNHLQSVAPSMVNTLQRALENTDFDTIQSVFEMARHSMVSMYGKKAERTLTKKTTTTTSVKQEEGFSSQAEMIKAINDPRYQRDAKYRAEVERKMLLTR